MIRRRSLENLLATTFGLALTLGIAFLIAIALIFVLSKEPGRTIYHFFVGPFANRLYFGNMLNAAGDGYDFTDQTVVDTAEFLKDLWDNDCAFATESYPNPEFATRKALFTMSSTAGLPYQFAAFEAEDAIQDAVLVAAADHIDRAEEGLPVQPAADLLCHIVAQHQPVQLQLYPSDAGNRQR